MWDTSGQSETPEDAEEMSVQGDTNTNKNNLNIISRNVCPATKIYNKISHCSLALSSKII